MISGSGTLLQALLDAPDLPADIVVVGADRDASGLARADRAGVPTVVVRPEDHDSRATWSVELADRLAAYAPDWIICAGLMRILDPAFLVRFPQRVVNSHPALLPAFPGAHAVRDALAYGVKVTGCTVHLVDDGVDTGPIIAQVAVPVLAGDDEDVLHERIKTAERELLVSVVTALVTRGHSVEGRKVTIP